MPTRRKGPNHVPISKEAGAKIDSVLRSKRMRKLAGAIGVSRVKRAIEKEAIWTAIWYGKDRVSRGNVQEAAGIILKALPKIGLDSLTEYADE